MLRQISAVVAVVTLVAGPGSAALAQNEAADPLAPAVVTGTVADWVGTSYGSRTVDDGFYRAEGEQWVATWEASDPRLSGEAAGTGNWQGYQEPWFEVWASTLEIVNDAGRWIGTGTGLATKPTSNDIYTYTYTDTDAFVLDGEGRFEGLTAYVILHYHDSEPPTFVGAIFPGEMTE